MFLLSEIRLGANAGARAVAANADDAAAAGGVRQHPGSTTALRGLMASLALRSASPWKRWAYEIDLAGCASCATRLCGALCGSGRPPRGGRRRSFVGGERLLVANGRCWRCRGSVKAEGTSINKPRDLRFGAPSKPSARAFGCLIVAVASKIFFPRHPVLAFFRVKAVSVLRGGFKPKMRASLD